MFLSRRMSLILKTNMKLKDWTNEKCMKKRSKKVMMHNIPNPVIAMNMRQKLNINKKLMENNIMNMKQKLSISMRIMENTIMMLSITQKNSIIKNKINLMKSRRTRMLSDCCDK